MIIVLRIELPKNFLMLLLRSQCTHEHSVITPTCRQNTERKFYKHFFPTLFLENDFFLVFSKMRKIWGTRHPLVIFKLLSYANNITVVNKTFAYMVEQFVERSQPCFSRPLSNSESCDRFFLVSSRIANIVTISLFASTRKILFNIVGLTRFYYSLWPVIAKVSNFSQLALSVLFFFAYWIFKSLKKIGMEWTEF